jgi:beta-lactamase superfamily II metal-dependent hydrolase
MLVSISRVLLFMLLPVSQQLWAQGNGKLQLHFVDVGQGDGAILISPGGQTVAFDIGQDMVSKDCDKPVAYYDQLGLTKLDHLLVSHYHQDHIGCIPDVLASVAVDRVHDRGKSYVSTFYDAYLKAVKNKRDTADVGEKIILDKDSANPVTISVYVVNANGKSTTNENDLSLGARITYGAFRAEIGGDLSGDNTSSYIDVETDVAAAVGKLDVYKVHHHCSSHSSNDAWLATTKPTIAIIRAGNGNTYSHPTEDCIERLHSVGTKTYWTERGNGATPVPGTDTISGTAIVNVDLSAGRYTVTHGSKAETYAIGGGTVSTGTGPSASFAWEQTLQLVPLQLM